MNVYIQITKTSNAHLNPNALLYASCADSMQQETPQSATTEKMNLPIFSFDLGGNESDKYY